MTFRTKTVLGIAVIEVVLLSILVWNSLSFLDRSNRERLLDYAFATRTLFSSTIKDAVIATDLAALESFTQEVINNPNLSYARILNQDGLVLAQSGDKDILKNEFIEDETLKDVSDDIFDTYKDISEGGTLFGRVEIGISTKSLANIIKEARKNIISVAMIEMVLTAVFSILLGFYLTKQLNQLKSASEHITRGERGYRIQVSGSDELAQTANAFNQMADALSKKEKDLIKSLEKTKEANKEKMHLLSNVNHELRTPMNAILGFSQLLKMDEKEFKDEHKKWINGITQSGEILLSSVNKILAFSSMKDKQDVKVVTEKVELSGALNDVYRISEELSRERSVTVTFQEVKKNLYIDVNYSYFKQVLLNLISNAIKYNCENGSVNLSIEQLPNSEIKFMVCDTGVGISNEQQAKVFDEFVRYNKDTYVSGTGIGLTIAKNLVTQMNGRIGVISELGEGSCFWVVFPEFRS